MVNIGQRIKDELLARKLNCTRASVYRIFEKNSIDTALLANISQVLHHNFFEELSDEVHSSMDE